MRDPLPSASTLASASLALSLAAACGAPPDEGPPPGIVDHPCGETWGPVPAEGRLYASADAGDADGDGSLGAPFPNLDRALAAGRASGIPSIALDAGAYAGSYVLSGDSEDWRDSGREIAGCGRGETEIAGIELEETLSTGETVWLLQPIFSIGGAGTVDVLIRDLAVRDARRAIVVREGAGAAGPIRIERVDVRDSVRVGVIVDGATTRASLQGVLVDGVEAEGGDFGWGIAVQARLGVGLAFGGATEIHGVEVRGAVGLGILGDGAFVDLRDSVVADIEATADGRLGRGVQLQRWSQGAVSGLVSRGNRDAAVFLESPGRARYAVDEEGNAVLDEDGNPVIESVEPVAMDACTLGDTAAGTVPGEGEATGDGIVATQYPGLGLPLPVATFLVELDGSSVTGNPRSQVLVEAVTLALGSNEILSKGTGLPFDEPVVAQGGAVVRALEGGEPPVEVWVADEGEALGLDRAPLALDDLLAGD